MGGTKKRRNDKSDKKSSTGGDATDKGDDNAILAGDSRFSKALTHPEFQIGSSSGNPKNRTKGKKGNNLSNKIVLDPRFASVLTDDRFRAVDNVADKYGRKKKKKNKEAAEAELAAFYTIEDPDESPSDDKDAPEESKGDDNDDDNDDDKSESSRESSDLDLKDPASRIAYLTALSRGEVSLSGSDSEDSDESSSDESSVSSSDSSISPPAHSLFSSSTYSNTLYSEDGDDHDGVELTNVVSPYLAIQNLDWSHMKAVDLLVILSSFSPTQGSVKKITVYPSDFGMKRMEKELTYGPSKKIWKKDKSGNDEEDEENELGTDDDSDDDNDNRNDPSEPVQEDFNAEKLRKYEASKLLYYFAIAEFTSISDASKVYHELDGLEFERSSSVMDLRVIDPDDLTQITSQRQKRDEACAIPGNYNPPDFVVNALQSTNIRCTWEEGDLNRDRKLRGGGVGTEGFEEDDFKAYLATTDSSESEEEEEGTNTGGGKRNNIRNLLGLDDHDKKNDTEDDSQSDDEQSDNDFFTQKDLQEDEKNDKNDQEELPSKEYSTSYIPGQEKTKKGLEEKIRDKLESSKKGQAKELTPWEKYQQKRKEKKGEKRKITRKKRRDNVPDDQDEEDDNIIEDKSNEGKEKDATQNTQETDGDVRMPSTKEELELLLAGDDDQENLKDYNMRSLLKHQKLATTKSKIKGAQNKRKMDKKIASTSSKGVDFQIDLQDSRFQKVLAGTHEEFGIDKSNPNFKETEAMKEVLAEQTQRRRKRAKKTKASDKEKDSGRADDLSSLVRKLKRNAGKHSAN